MSGTDGIVNTVLLLNACFIIAAGTVFGCCCNVLAVVLVNYDAVERGFK